MYTSPIVEHLLFLMKTKYRNTNIEMNEGMSENEKKIFDYIFI